VRVIAIDQRLVQGAEAPPKEAQDRTVTLEVTPDQAQRVSVAVRLGRLSLAVRSAEPAATPAAQQRTGGTTWAGDVSPALHDDTPVSSGVVRVFQGAADGKEFRF
jgi:pilus assembly protein CpaB